MAGFSVTNYDLYVDGSATPTVVTNNMWTLANLAPAGAHTFSLDYVLADQRSAFAAVRRRFGNHLGRGCEW